MSISLTDHTSTDVAKLAADLIQKSIISAEPIGKGANSRVYRLSSDAGECVIKFYFQHPHDSRDRMGTEFKSLVFLWNQGIRQIPQPLSIWPNHTCALYSMVEGISPVGQINDQDIDQAARFLNTLKELTQTSASKDLAAASEAFFCGKDIVRSLRARLKRFELESAAEEYVALKRYLENDLIPLLETVEAWSKDFLSTQGIAWDQDLSPQQRTLSPSDFGFHNALRNSKGEVVFLDFEYFGWDDPAKTVSDFLLHPAMNLNEALRQRFMKSIKGVFNQDSQFEHRLKAFYPLFGLKWCLIFLNEFVDSDMQRRGFARSGLQDKKVIRLKQLAKAESLSQQIKAIYKDFSYGN